LRNRSGMNTSGFSYSDSSWPIAHALAKIIVSLGMTWLPYVSSSVTAWGMPPGTTGRQRRTWIAT
jgi:hypothetical protein